MLQSLLLVRSIGARLPKSTCPRYADMAQIHPLSGGSAYSGVGNKLAELAALLCLAECGGNSVDQMPLCGMAAIFNAAAELSSARAA